MEKYTLKAHKESFDRKHVEVLKTKQVTMREWISPDGEIPSGAKIIDSRINRFGMTQNLYEYKQTEPSEWRVFYK